MEKHPYFALWLHSTTELSQLIGCPVVDRQVIQEWPLSCVQFLRLADGRRWIYKSQHQSASVEAEFYQAARSAWLPHFTPLGAYQDSIMLLFEHLAAPRLETLNLSEAEITRHGQRLVEGIQQLGQANASLPVYTEIGSLALWQNYAEQTLGMLERLVYGQVGRPAAFHLTRPEDIAGLERWAASSRLLALWAAPPAFQHGDLAGDNVFVTPDGYKLIDWQRPLRGPAGLDLVNFYESLGLNPLGCLEASRVELAWFIRLRWFLDCQTRFFPAGDYDPQVAELAHKIIQAKEDRQ